MKYRIKVIEKNNGEKEFYPMYKDEDGFGYNIKIIFFPLAFIAFLFNSNGSFLPDYFWTNISREVNEEKRGDFILTGDEDVICKSEEEAKLEIKKHYEQHVTERNKQEEIKKTEHLNKNKTTYYLTVINPL